MSIVNVQRDFMLLDPDQTELTWPTNSSITGSTINMNADSNVYDDAASAEITDTATVSGNNIETIGCYIHQPIDDRTPYRIKATAQILDVRMNETFTYVVVGWAPASPTGTNDAIDQPVFIPFTRKCDELILVPHQESGDTYFGRALAVGVGIAAGSTYGISSKIASATISVQRLGTKPPTMHNAVS
jgi:hypothetical protein